jgi:hypothetical protein
MEWIGKMAQRFKRVSIVEAISSVVKNKGSESKNGASRMYTDHGTIPITNCPSTLPFFTGCCSCPVAAGTFSDT